MKFDIKKILKVIWDVFTTALIILVLALAIMLGGVRVVGLQTLVVLSGSMEPTYPTGSLIYLKDVKTSELKAGDVITFELEAGTVVTHRIVEVITEGGDTQYRTRGDANDFDDAELVQDENVIGTPVFGIPKLGYLAQYILSPPGTYVAVFVGAALMLLMFLPDLFASEEKTESEETDIRKENALRRKAYKKRRKQELKQQKQKRKAAKNMI